jgi:chromate transport protein ChrA
LATYVGWLLHKTWGGVVAGAFFVIPSMFILWGLSYIYVTFGNLPWIAAIFYGLKPAVLANSGGHSWRFGDDLGNVVPCFLWIFLGGPYIEKLRGNEGLTTTLSAVTAAVVGVVLNLAVWFGLHVIFPSANVVDWFAVVLGLAAFVAMIKWKVDIIPVVLGAGLLGLIFKTLF